MPYQIQAEASLIRISFTGHVTKAELFAAAEELARLELKFERMPDRLIDLSNVEERESDYPTLSRVAEDRQARVFPNAFRSAIIAPTTVSYGFARMFQNLNQNPQIDIQIFKSAPEARAWLASPR